MKTGMYVRLVFTLLCLTACSGRAPTVDEITIINSTEYDVDVDVTGPDRDGWLPVAIVGARSEKVAQGVVDLGDRWIFRFVHWGDPVGERSLTRSELERNGWRVEVPEQIQERLQQLGRPPSA